MKRIKKFGVFQTAKVFAIIYFIIAAIFMIPFGLLSTALGSEAIPGFPVAGGLFLILIPFIYGFIAFIMIAIACLVYNLIAQKVGGIELEIEITE